MLRKKMLFRMFVFLIALWGCSTPQIKVNVPQLPKPVVNGFSYIDEKASNLGYNAERIADYVKNSIENEDYQGLLRGAVGSLWSEAGNEIDKTELAYELFRYSGVPAKIKHDNEGYYIEYFKDNRWVELYPSKKRNSSSSEEVSVWPESVKNKIKIAIRLYNSQNGYKDDITFDADTYSLIGKKVVLGWEKGQNDIVRSLLHIDTQTVTGNENVFAYDKAVVVFKVSSPDGKEQEYNRVIFDKNRISGHSQPNIEDKYVCLILPNTISKHVIEKENDLIADNNADKAKRSVNGPYMLSLGYAYFSDVVTKALFSKMQAGGYYNSPRIIIASSEIESVADKEIKNSSLDLLKNDIFINSDKAADINLVRCVSDNTIESMVVDKISKNKSISAANLFNKILDVDNINSKNTFLGRIGLYNDVILKMINDKNDQRMEISGSSNTVILESSAGSKSLKLYVSDADAQTIEKNTSKEVAFESKGGKNEKTYLFADKDSLLYDIECIFLKGFNMKADFEPVFRRNAIPVYEMYVSNFCNLKYKVRNNSRDLIINGYLRHGDYGNMHNFEWDVHSGTVPDTTQLNFPAEYTDGYREFTFIDWLAGIDNTFKIGIKNLNNFIGVDVSTGSISYTVSVNGEPVCLQVKEVKRRVYEHYKDQTKAKLWVWQCDKYSMVVKVQAGEYTQELVSIDNYDVPNILKGFVGNRVTKKGINKAAVNIDGQVVKSWPDGSFDVQQDETRHLAEESILFIFDNSGSMNENAGGSPESKYELLQSAAAYLIDLIPGGVEVMIHDFYSMTNSHDRYFIFSKASLLKTIEKKNDSVGTPLTDAVYKSIDIMKKNSVGKYKRVVILSDGENTNSAETMADAYKKSGVLLPFYTIGFGVLPGSKAENELKEVAEISGGKYIRAESLDDLKEAFEQVSLPATHTKKKISINAEGFYAADFELDDNAPLNFDLDRKPAEEINRLVVLSKDNQNELDSISIKEHTKKMIRERLVSDENIRILVPVKPIDYNVAYTTAWFEYNRKTGYLVGVTEDGLHGSCALGYGDDEGAAIVHGISDEIADEISSKIEKVETMRKYGSFLAGMLNQISGILDGVNETIDSNMSLREWMEYIDEHAFIFAKSFKSLAYDGEYYDKGMRSISEIFRTGETNELSDTLGGFVQDAFF